MTVEQPSASRWAGRQVAPSAETCAPALRCPDRAGERCHHHGPVLSGIIVNAWNRTLHRRNHVVTFTGGNDFPPQVWLSSSSKITLWLTLRSRRSMNMLLKHVDSRLRGNDVAYFA